MVMDLLKLITELFCKDELRFAKNLEAAHSTDQDNGKRCDRNDQSYSTNLSK